MTGNCNEDKVL